MNHVPVEIPLELEYIFARSRVGLESILADFGHDELTPRVEDMLKSLLFHRASIPDLIVDRRFAFVVFVVRPELDQHLQLYDVLLVLVFEIR
jgi:hypothetical protein